MFLSDISACIIWKLQHLGALNGHILVPKKQTKKKVSDFIKTVSY